MIDQETTAFQSAEKMTPVAPIPEVETPQPEELEEEKVTCLYCGAMSPISRETCSACGCVLKK